MKRKMRISTTCPLIQKPSADLPPSTGLLVSLLNFAGCVLKYPMPELKMSCFRRLVLCLSIFAYSISPVAASTNRLAALGGETRLLLDTSNIFLYPASATEIPHLGVDLFDDWGGVVYALGSRRALGLFLNRSTPQLERFNAYLSQNVYYNLWL